MLNRNLEYKDITQKEISKVIRNCVVKEQNYYEDDNGNKYNVDNKNVILKPTKREKEVADILSKFYGKDVKIIPRINYPKEIKTPDYIMEGEKFDLKQITGNGKYVIQGNLKGKSKQSNNFIIDITKSQMDNIDALKQIENIYKSKHYLWVDKIVLINNNEIQKIYNRK